MGSIDWRRDYREAPISSAPTSGGVYGGMVHECLVHSRLVRQLVVTFVRERKQGEVNGFEVRRTRTYRSIQG